MADSDLHSIFSFLEGYDPTYIFLRDRSADSETMFKLCKPPPPIFKLHQELLWYIFVFNSHAHMKLDFNARYLNPGLSEEEIVAESEALTTNRYTSQVCSRWRELMLKSSSIWANSLYLGSLDQKEDHWRTKVMARTGSALLTVVGEMDITNPQRRSFYCTPFFLKILEENWKRLRSLTIRSCDLLVDEKLRLLSQLPAPNLEGFKFLVNAWRGEIATAQHCIPFADHAPRLHTFRNQANDFRFLGSCFDKLRHFLLEGSSGVFTAAELLRGLQQMPLLETLFLRHFDMRPKIFDETTPTIHLRHLIRIVAVEDSEIDGAILNVIPYIKVGRRCQLTVCNDGWAIDNVVLAVSTFLKNNTDPSETTEISYTLNDTRSRLSVYPNLTVGLSGPGKTPVNLSVVFLISYEIYEVFYPMAKSLSLFDLRNVTKLSFSIEDVDIDTTFPNTSVFDVILFLQALKSVDELHSGDNTLDLLNRLDNIVHTTSSGSPVPACATLPKLSFLHTDGLQENLTSYCTQRHAMGVPLKNIHVGKGNPVLPSGEKGGLDLAISLGEV